jgi:uncharacterized membrane protein (UPF0182 family)
MSSANAPTLTLRRRPRRRGPLIPTLVVIAVVLIAFFALSSFWTSKLWFDTLSAGDVFSTSIVTRIVLFFVFAAISVVIVGGSCWIAWRWRPSPLTGRPNEVVDRYREAVDSHRRLMLLVPAVIVGLFAGASATSRWQTYLGWRNRTPFGVADAQFGKDASFYVFTYPWLRFLLTFAFVIVILAIIASLVTHLAYGGVRVGGRGQRATAAAHIQLAILLGVFCGLKALGYWLDRYGLVLQDHKISNFSFTGLTYAGEHAVLPGRTILLLISLVCALLFFANVARRTWLLPGLGLAILVLASVLLGWLWPAIVQQFQVRPNEPDRESSFIGRNIDATRSAFGLGSTEVTQYSAKTTATAGQLRDDAEAVPGIRLMDPTLVSESFEQLQQVRGFYAFPRILDVDRYTIDGEVQDAVVAVREVDLSGLPSAQRNWNNDHTVFTHGYGLVSAYGNRAATNGAPVWMEKDLPSTGALGEFEQRIYFGEESPDYSIVGQPAGAGPIELDVPGDTDGKQSAYTYDGTGGVGIGSLWTRALYAAKFTDANFLLSRRINTDSKLLYDRDPSVRVEKVAPWLTVDSDPHPAVVDGRTVWIVDAYTTTSTFPNAQRVDLDEATADTLTARRAGAVPSVGVNYMRNSVKATVDAYDGTVKLYAWDPTDPILQTWEKVFPGMVAPKSEMSKDLISHVRYPEDMYKVQRELLGQYHVTNPKVFYEGTERWTVPNDPTDSTQARRQPPYYLSVKMPGQNEAHFSLTSTYIPVNKQNLAAFVAVDADASSPDYGKMRVLQLAGESQVNGPGQVAQSMQTDQSVSQTLLALQRSGSLAVPGNLLTLPMGGGLLYVQPYYAQRQGTNSGSYPLLRLVIVQFGDKVASGASLQQALDSLFSGDSGATTDESQTGTTPPATGGTGGTGGTGSTPAEVQAQLDAASSAFAAADKALKAGDIAGYAAAVEKAEKAVAAAQAAQDASKASPSPSPSPSPEPKP